MIESALALYALGLSVIPVGDDKHPIGYWTVNQSELVKPTPSKFSSCYGVGIVCGDVSGKVEVIDIDTKYDLKGTLFQSYKELINSIDPDLLKKMVVEQTPSGGYHFIYKCEVISGNTKLANRHTTDEEKSIDPKEKQKVLIETRGEGGYIMCHPSPNYNIVYGSFDKINIISIDERNILLDCAKTFNECFKEVHVKKEHKEIISENLSPFDDWNNRGDVIDFLETEGWKTARTTGAQTLLLRPGGTGRWSADFNSDKRLFYVFSSSTEFDNEKAYNPTQVLAIIKFNSDYSACAKWLVQNGYGETIKKPMSLATIDDTLSFIATNEDTDGYINQMRDGTFKMGLTTGYPDLDIHWRFKSASLTVFLGHDNVGKSVMTWFFAVVSAKLHGWKWVIYSAENKMGGVKLKLMEFAANQKVTKMTQDKYNETKLWVEKHFIIIKNKELYNYVDILSMARKILEKQFFNGMLVDPYNALDPDDSDKHNFDYRAMGEMRLFNEQTGVSIFLNCHAVTEALRRKYPKEHAFAGYPMPPDKADTEGGGKFSNRADDFITIHRLVQHSDEWVFTEIHVKKIKEMETGGKPTHLDTPIKLKLMYGTGFENVNGVNPLDKHQAKISYNITPNKFTEPESDDDEGKPF